jgi:glucose-1-phosphate thymidylyltransferase
MKKDLGHPPEGRDMDAVVLAGGYATRLWPITKHRPKMFLPIGEETVIDRIFAGLEAEDRVETVYVSTNARFAEEFEDYLADSTYEKPTLSVEETTAEEEKFGVVGALAQLVDREGITDDLLVLAGDNLISFDVSEFVDFFEVRGTPTIAAYDVGSRERASSYGLVELEGTEVRNFQEKPDDPQSTLVSIATYAFPADSLSLLGTYLEGDNNPDEPGWFVQWLQERGPVHAFTFDGAWFDIGTPESYLEAVRWALDGASVVADSATVEGTEIGDNVHVMADAHVEDSQLHETVIFPAATIRNCEVRDSIVDRETHIENIDFSGALIGAHTEITNPE